MTRLRKMILEELERRNYSEATTRCYIRTVEDFSRRFKRSPDCLGPEHIREYQAELFKKRKLSPGTVTQRLAALRFFYIKTLKKTRSIAETPYPKKGFHLPSILSREEVARLIDAALTPYHRVLLMTLYATGVRRAELTHLKVSDIDSKRMVIHVQGGKGRKDRDVMLSPKLLEAPREHWRGLPRKPTAWLFPGNRWHTGDAAWLRPLFRKDWVIYAKPPFGGPDHVLRYLGRYTHRVAISNHRLVLFADGEVTFRWRDSAHNNEQKLMTLSLDEFLRRFLLHLLPKGFVRIRNFGLLANRRHATTLPLCFQLLGSAPQAKAEASIAGASDAWLCPKCGGPMLLIERFTAAELQLRSPPTREAVAA